MSMECQALRCRPFYFMRRFLFVALTAGLLSPIAAQAEEVRYNLTNGDTITGELIKEESSNKTKVIVSPLLGKIRISSSSIVVPKEKTPPSRWGTEFSVGLNSSTTSKAKDSSYVIDISTTYSGERNNLSIEADYHYDEVTENNKTSTGASSGGLDLRNDFINEGKYNFYTNIEYDYNALNTSGKNRTIAGFGLSKDFLANQNRSLKISLGPAIQWATGGKDCSTDNNCGDAYYSSRLQATYDWSITKLFNLILDHKFTATHASELLKGSESTATLKFIPSIDSPYYSKLEYKNSYQDLTTPKTKDSYFLGLGKSF